jgi:hypothetical protein
MTAADANLMTPRAFAASLGFKPHYGNQLAKDGRLVMAPDGKHVLVAESKARLEATRDPSKQANVERHAAARAAAVGGVVPEPVFPPLEGDADGMDLPPAAQYSYAEAKAKREHWAAEREHAAWRKEAGELMERGEVVDAFADAGATMRGKLESWAAVLPPQLVGRDEAAIRATLADQVERLLHDLVEKFNKAAREGE